jgi:hypothetical protein
MAIDKNPRKFMLAVIDIDTTLNVESGHDFVTIKLAGHVTPSVKERLAKALNEGHYKIEERRLV